MHTSSDQDNLPSWVKCDDCQAYIELEDVRRSGATCPNCQSTTGLRVEALTGEPVEDVH